MSELQIAINSRVRDYLHRHDAQDLDEFSRRFSAKSAELLTNGHSSSDAARLAVAGTHSQLFRINKGKVSKEALVGAMALTMAEMRIAPSLGDKLLRFKFYAERQLIQVLKNPGDEETFRSSMQTYLAGEYLTYREVLSGAGRSDILIVEPYRELIEAKLWRGQSYFDDGLTELATYLGTENIERGYYLNLEFGEAASFLSEKGSDRWQEQRNGKVIEVLFVRVPKEVPSKIGASERRARKAQK